MKKWYGAAALAAGLLIVLALAWWGITAPEREHEERSAAIRDLSWRLAVLEQGNAPGGIEGERPRESSRVQAGLSRQVQELARRVAKVEQLAGTEQTQGLMTQLLKSESDVRRLSGRLDEINTAMLRLERDTSQGDLRQSLTRVRNDTAQLGRRVDDLERSTRADEASPDRRELEYDIRGLLRDVDQLQRDLESLESRVARIERDR